MLCICITYINSLSWMPYLCIFTVLAYVFCYGFGLGPIPYFIGSEKPFIRKLDPKAPPPTNFVTLGVSKSNLEDVFRYQLSSGVIAELSSTCLEDRPVGRHVSGGGGELFEVSPRPVAMSYGSMANWGGNFVVGMTFPSLQVLIGQYSFLLFAATTIMLAVFLKYYLPETKGRESSDIAEILKHGFLSDINTPPLYTSQRLASVSSNPPRLRCNSETVSVDIVTATDSPSNNVRILAQNNSYTNLSAISEQFQAVSDFPKSPTNPHPVHAMMPSIPENLDSSSIIATGGGKQNM
uniref:Uncharacterized protein n=1 Tax=Timema cristinae TaxID=61476 RepID=A0A7R9CLX9_TIMCR|nr:unnamed protein product [Timema cristinae]